MYPNMPFNPLHPNMPNPGFPGGFIDPLGGGFNPGIPGAMNGDGSDLIGPNHPMFGGIGGNQRHPNVRYDPPGPFGPGHRFGPQGGMGPGGFGPGPGGNQYM